MGRDDQLRDFFAYNFDNNQEFTKWLASVEVMSSDPAVMQKCKARWYKRIIPPCPSLGPPFEPDQKYLLATTISH
ncbi:hypothetical protein HaLaN_19407 [Haematococcus lacustris]|uniref:Uncharacterized protein n=1 Tax=Haematococcus lacustris TaxID=44745 RepID=A0A699ZQS0_HAELA|nr:hypothetical protein HaLaN_19407 [Haematococcus lacustris]